MLNTQTSGNEWVTLRFIFLNFANFHTLKPQKSDLFFVVFYKWCGTVKHVMITAIIGSLRPS